MRHRARFRIKNLSHQFLGLRLPESARKVPWSVVVDGVGVKPALLPSGALIIPLTLARADRRDRQTRIDVVFEERSGATNLGEPVALRAPALKIVAGPQELLSITISGIPAGAVLADAFGVLLAVPSNALSGSVTFTAVDVGQPITFNGLTITPAEIGRAHV